MRDVQQDRPPCSAILQTTPIIAVLRARHASEYMPVVEALVKGGVRSIELTLSTSGVFEELPKVLTAVGSQAEVGVGTVTTEEEARQALDVGAAFIVTPVMELGVVRICRTRGVPVYPGGLSPSELFAGWRSGATAVKIFPASTVGPGYLDQLRGPFPDLAAIPSGGVDAQGAVEWIRAGATAVSIGGPLIQDAFANGEVGSLEVRARDLRLRVEDALASRGGESQ